ncbi:RGAP1 protein, partial [Atractosteus spatula]|nr:RGAP1 protein [Atractosteus spatula]
EFIQLAVNFEDCRRKWLKSEQELVSCKEVLAKAETERGALEVKLKHARNQVDVEVRRRQKAEAECEKLDRQIQLIRELLITEGSTSIQLNEEQRSALAFLNARTQAAPQNTSRRLTTIDESASILSDISYDKTDDSLDWDSSVVRTVRLKKREKRVSEWLHVDGPPAAAKRSRSSGKAADKVLISSPFISSMKIHVCLCSTLVFLGSFHTFPLKVSVSQQSTIKMGKLYEFDKLSSLRSFTFTYTSNSLRMLNNRSGTPDSTLSPQQRRFTLPFPVLTLQVIKPESCVPCGKRIKFGKLSLKCRDCRVVAHPECRDRCPLPCIPTLGGTPVRIGEGTLADYVPTSSPMIPSLVVHCVNEIEQRGLHETGLYRLSGMDRTVKELKEKFLRGKTVPLLSKVDDIHAICGLLKDFLRNLKEPLLTFRLNRAFMEAAEISDDDNSIASMYQTISELPQANRDTLAFLIIHLQRVAQSPDTKMDIPNLAKVFGPTILGHAVPDPDPMTILQDTKRQPKVICGPH